MQCARGEKMDLRILAGSQQKDILLKQEYATTMTDMVHRQDLVLKVANGSQKTA